MKTVAILGGGVAGLSAAHELAERGFRVDVYELKPEWGGKARSIDVECTATYGNRDLPGEHGFRFFPGFYKHLPDTMRRIPVGARSAFDSLVPCTECNILQTGSKPIRFPLDVPQKIREILKLLLHLRTIDTGLAPGEAWHFAWRLLRFLASCDKRRLEQWEREPWWTYIGADTRSRQYGKLLGAGLTRSLVAMRAEEGSTRSVATILIQLILDIISPLRDADRVLNAPTNEAWIHPWLDHFHQQSNVNLHSKCELKGFELEGRRIKSAVMHGADGTRNVEADAFIAAVPVEVLRSVATGELNEASPIIRRLADLKVEWMNGIQFFLRRRVDVARGHVIHSDSPWALTSISQPQFWAQDAMRRYGDGTAVEVLSIDISDWTKPGVTVKYPAGKCTKDEIVEDVWTQVKQHLTHTGIDPITDDDRIAHFLDPAIIFPPPGASDEQRGWYHQLRGLRSVDELLANYAVLLSQQTELRSDGPTNRNLEPLLVNTAGSWALRPDARIDIDNLFLASDYVRTHTDLACMEGANEAARRAVNALLDAAASPAPRCTIWPLREPAIFRPLQAVDRMLLALFGGRPRTATT